MDQNYRGCILYLLQVYSTWYLGTIGNDDVMEHVVMGPDTHTLQLLQELSIGNMAESTDVLHEPLLVATIHGIGGNTTTPWYLLACLLQELQVYVTTCEVAEGISHNT